MARVVVSVVVALCVVFWLALLPGRTAWLLLVVVLFEKSTSPESRSSRPGVTASYVKPVWAGWSMYSMLEALFQLQGLTTVVLESLCTMHGPLCPPTTWSMVAAPGPPCTHNVTGAVLGFCRASKNQKNMWLSYGAVGSSPAGRVR